MDAINFRTLYDELGVGALVPHAFTRTGEAYELIAKKILDEADLYYISLVASGTPYMDTTLDGTILSVFDSQVDADMCLQDVAAIGLDAELRSFSKLIPEIGDGNRASVFIRLYNLGFQFLRLNNAINIPLHDIVTLPESFGFVGLGKELANPTLLGAMGRWVQISMVGNEEDKINAFFETLEEIGNTHVCLPVILRDGTPTNRALEADDFIAPALDLDMEDGDPHSILVFPDSHTFHSYFKHHSPKELGEIFKAGLHFYLALDDLVQVIDPTVQIVFVFSPTSFYVIPPDLVVGIRKELGLE